VLLTLPGKPVRAVIEQAKGIIMTLCAAGTPRQLIRRRM
jgi:hypothetical protein